MNQIKLPIQNIKHFLSYSNSLGSGKTDIMPILKYVKIVIDFDIITMAKSNLDSFVIYEFDFKDNDDIEFLISEDELKAFVSVYGNNTYIYITIENHNFGTISDGKSYTKRFNSSEASISEFPKENVRTVNLEYTRLSKNEITLISYASNFTATDEIRPSLSHIFIQDEFIVSCDMKSLFTYRIGSFKNIAISKRELSVITNNDFIDYYSDEDANFNVYKHEKAIFGFKKMSDVKCIDFKKPLEAFKDDNSFIIKKEDIVGFCNSVAFYCKNGDKKRENAKWKNSVCSLDFGKCELKFDMEAEVGESIITNCDVNQKGDDFRFTFNQAFTQPIFNEFPYDEICLADNNFAVFLFNKKDNNFLAFISKVG